MNSETAKELLLAHGRMKKNHPIKESGFVGMLSPYKGLRVENFHEVMQSLIAISEEIAKSPSLDRELISALWNIVNQSSSYGVSPDGDLQRCTLITQSDIKLLTKWVRTIELTIQYSLMGLSGKNNPQICAYNYEN